MEIFDAPRLFFEPDVTEDYQDPWDKSCNFYFFIIFWAGLSFFPSSSESYSESYWESVLNELNDYYAPAIPGVYP